MLSRILGVIGRVLIVAGLFILGFVVFQLWGTSFEEGRHQAGLTDELIRRTAAIEGVNVDGDARPDDLSKALAEVDVSKAAAMEAPPEGDPVGILEIPRIDLSRVLVQGVSKEDLKMGPGHYAGTPLPGQPGNVGIAGHRTTYGAPFNRIDELQIGDDIIVSTPQGQFTYHVVAAPGLDRAWFSVPPSEVSVLADTGDDRITLTACHPKYSARERIVVQGVLATPAATASASSTNTPAPSVAAAAFDESLRGDSDSLLPTLLFGVGIVVVLLAAWAAGHYWRKWPSWLIVVPVLLVLLWFCYVYLDRYLPAL